MISFITAMIITTPIFEYPNGQFHYCFENYNIAIKGNDGIVYPKGSGKSQYGETNIYDSCFHLNDYFNKTSSIPCTITNLSVVKNVLLYKNGGCSIGVNFKDNLETKHNINLISSEIKHTLNTKYGENHFKHAYFVDSEHIVYDYPLGTSHFCFDNNHIVLSGYDNVVYGDKIDSKYAYSFSNIDDSCNHSFQYFSRLNNKQCNFDELSIHPMRSYGYCFISSQTINKTLTTEYQTYLFDVSCHGCNYGLYYHISNNSNKNISNTLLVSILFIGLSIIFI